MNLFGDDKQQIQDQELFRAKDFALQTVTVWMRFCGIKKVQLNRTRASGTSILSELSWKGVDETIPDVVKHIRPYALLNVIKLFLDMFGVSLVELELENNEAQEQKKYWDFIVKGDGTSTGKPELPLELKTVPLNIEKDPTNKVIDNVIPN